MTWVETIGLVAGVVLPLWNVPLILRIHRRRSSQDISLAWALGVFGCLLLMLPASLRSADPVFKIFGIVNVAVFSVVVVTVFRYR